ncbi:hypothetical protein AVEN_168427-1 [Araneus ventricosus]|uniref:Uncharacterized protein n=1 Tax=Araneus ventricosus TaxID=182803 RepID=A0A4Y2JBE4_ARAVE|nr:hypothetical protein AVEN_168427-1 [Araneus ventricosus]
MIFENLCYETHVDILTNDCHVIDSQDENKNIQDNQKNADKVMRLILGLCGESKFQHTNVIPEQEREKLYSPELLMFVMSKKKMSTHR